MSIRDLFQTSRSGVLHINFVKGSARVASGSAFVVALRCIGLVCMSIIFHSDGLLGNMTGTVYGGQVRRTGEANTAERAKCSDFEHG